MKIAFIVTPSVELLDLSGPAQVFTEAISYGLEAEMAFYAFQPNVESSSGLAFGKLPGYKKAKLQEGDFVFIPGVDFDALDILMKAEPAFVEWLKNCNELKVNICSICNASFVLGEAGLLDNKKSTTHWSRTELMQALFPKTKVLTDVLYVKSENIYTSAGISSGIDMALDILEELKGPKFTHKVARGLVVYHRRSGDHQQNSIYLDYRNHINPKVHEVQDYLIDHLREDNSIENLAAMVAMSPRNLTRVFKENTGTTIGKYLTELRAEKARLLLNDPENTIDMVAAKCGYKSARQLQRILKK